MHAHPSPIGATIRAARLSKRIKQYHAAKLIGVSPSALNQWEAGKTVPSFENLMKVSRVLGVDLAKGEPVRAPANGPSLAEAIESYRAGLAAFAALPDEAVTRETEDNLYKGLVHQYAQRLIDWPAPAQSMDEALAALDLVEKDMEDFVGNRMAGAMFRAALAYLKAERGTT